MPALNQAGALRLGAKTVSRAYLGAKQVWPLVTAASKVTFTIDHTKVAADLTDFPVYLNLNGVDLDTSAGVTCYIDGVEAPCEVFDEYREMHVKVPLLSSTVDTVITVDPAAPGSLAISEVWSADYVSVYHFLFEETVVSTPDSASGYDGVASTPDGATGSYGAIGAGVQLDGLTTLSASTAGIITGANPRTMSAWVYIESGDNVTIWGQGLADIGTLFEMTKYNGNLIFHGYGGGFDTISISAPMEYSTVYHCCLTYDGDAMKVYLDGNFMGEVTGMTLDTGTAFNNLGGPGYFGPWTGIIDEARLSSVARSPEWIATEYANQSDSGSFYAVGSA